RSSFFANHSRMSCCGMRALLAPGLVEALPFLYAMIGPICCAARSRSFGLFAPQFDPPAAAALNEAADGRGQKYSSLVNGWAISREPTTRSVPSVFLAVIRLPLAFSGNTL